MKYSEDIALKLKLHLTIHKHKAQYHLYEEIFIHSNALIYLSMLMTTVTLNASLKKEINKEFADSANAKKSYEFVKH